MPNYCDYSMKIKGSKDAIKRVVECLKADYNYGEGKPSHKHFFRVFEASEGDLVNEGNGIYSQYVYGYCAWSVYCCMCSGAYSYYDSLKKDYPDLFMGTTLEEQSQDCEIEVFSEEIGVGFSEHFIYKNGVCVCDDNVDIESAGYDEEGNVTTDIDWDTYGGETTTINPHINTEEETYRWEI